MILEKLKSINKLCTGCSACHDICAVNAIEMQPDAEGFSYPHIDNEKCVNCGRCEKVCPVLNTEYNNSETPDCYAMMAKNENERVTSASGGFVSVLARWIIKQGGCVYGASWTSDWNAKHICIDNENDLPKIKGSIYFQGKIENIYNQVSENLKQGKLVLFTGLPCQIAGLYAVLKNQPKENLITVDLMCHGTPSNKVFKKYLNENYDVDRIASISFRNKNFFGWSTTTTTTTYKEGNIIYTSTKEDDYYKAFLPCMIMRPSCSVCPFSRLPRQGDFTAGDFWGVERVEPKWNDKKGTSAILLNNDKSKKIIDEIKNEFKLWEKVSLDDITNINKTVLHPFHSHPGRKHFFSSFDLKPFKKLVQDSLSHHYDIGIVGLWYGINYGSILTYFALYKLLRDLGYDPVFLPKPDILWSDQFNSPDSIAQKFIWKHCNVFNPYHYQEDYTNANDSCDDFIVGSDVVFNYEIVGRQSDMFFFLDWVESGHKKIAFSSSFGNGLTGTENYKTKAKYYLNQFDAISIREEINAEKIKNELNRSDIVCTLDPVFLCDSKVYEDIIDKVEKKENEKFVFAYFLRRENFKSKLEILEFVGSSFSANIKICGNPVELDFSKEKYGKNVMPLLSVEEWLYYIRNCEMYVGDSFHGLCFSLIFHKPFIIIFTGDKINSIARFENLLRLVGLESRLLKDEKDFSSANKLVNTKIDWEKVDSILEAQKQFSLNWLKNVLAKQKTERTSEQIIRDDNLRKQNNALRDLKRKTDEQSHRIDELMQKIEQLEKQKNILREFMDLLENKWRKCTLKLVIDRLLRHKVHDNKHEVMNTWGGGANMNALQHKEASK